CYAAPRDLHSFPTRRSSDLGVQSDRIPWYDYALALTGLISGLYLSVYIPRLVDLVLTRPVDGVIAGTVMILLTVEALRRSSGQTLPIIVVLFILYALFADVIPEPLVGRSTDPQRLGAYLAIDVNGMLGTPIIVATTVIIPFLLFGNLLSSTGGAEFLSDLSLALM